MSDLGILCDWCALWQAPRTPEQQVAFKTGLNGIKQWSAHPGLPCRIRRDMPRDVPCVHTYGAPVRVQRPSLSHTHRHAHQGATVWLITAGTDRVKGLTYWDKGWMCFEFALAMMIKPANTTFHKDWAQVVDLGKTGDAQTEFARPMLPEPLAFFAGHTYGHQTFTDGADRDAIVAPMFRDTVFEVLAGIRELDFSGVGWRDAEIEALSVNLPLCIQLTDLDLSYNEFGDTGLAAMARASSAIFLQTLRLEGNCISDAGFTALAQVCSAGGLSTLRALSLGSNFISDGGIKSLADACAGGALANVTDLNFEENQISDGGIRSLADACVTGALYNVASLNFEENQISDDGFSAFADASAGGAFQNVAYLNFAANRIGNDAMVSFADSCASGALTQLKWLYIDAPSAQLTELCSSRGIGLNSGH